MTYSATDFADDVFNELHRVGAITPDEFGDQDLEDNAELQRDYALNGIERLANARDCAVAAATFMDELLASVDTVTGVAEEHGVRTLADLIYLHSAIISSGFIDHYPGESMVLQIVHELPSSEKWMKYIKVEHLSPKSSAAE